MDTRQGEVHNTLEVDMSKGERTILFMENFGLQAFLDIQVIDSMLILILNSSICPKLSHKSIMQRLVGMVSPVVMDVQGF